MHKMITRPLLAIHIGYSLVLSVSMNEVAVYIVFEIPKGRINPMQMLKCHLHNIDMYLKW